MSCCGKKRKQAVKGAKPTLASPAGVLMRGQEKPKPVTPPVTGR